MSNFILSIDQGTTGTTALLVDAKSLKVVDKYNQEFRQIFPKPSWVEHDLNDIWKTVELTVSHILKKNGLSGKEIKSIGITNQRETTCAYDKSGNPLANAIVWQDRRTTNYCHDKKESYQQLKNKTGLPLDPYFSGTKMNWLLTNNSNVSKAGKEKNLRLSTIDTFLVYKLTNNNSFATEPSNASRTLLMNLSTCKWDNSLLEFFNLDKSYLPEIKNSFDDFGVTNGLSFLPDGIPINCILGDQQAALFGQAGYKAGELKCTYGTGAFILLNTGEDLTYSTNGLLTTIAYQHKGKICYALEGSCYIAGAAVQWLRDNVNIIENSSDVERLARKVDNFQETEFLTFMPFFTGIGSPYWNPDAKGAIVGITRDTEQKHLAKVCLEGIALSVNDSINALVSDSPNPVRNIKVDGGACANNLLMEMQANFSEKTIIRPEVIETTAYGVALGAMVGCGELDFDKISTLWKEQRTFQPEKNRYFHKKKAMWKDLITKLYF